MENSKQVKLQELLLLAVKADGAEMGTIRNYESVDNELVIVSHYGFPPEYISYFMAAKPFDHSSCGRAFGIGSTILISDIEHDLAFKKQLKIIRTLRADYRAVKSMPIMSLSGRKLGVVSTYFKTPKWDWQLDSLDRILPEMADLLY